MTVPLNGQVIGQAERATRALLDRLLAGAGTSFEQWVALNLTATSGPLSAAELASRLRIPVQEATSALSALTVEGLLARDGTLTVAGRSRHEDITTELAGITARLYGDVPADDLAVAGRVLTLITARATAELGTP